MSNKNLSMSYIFIVIPFASKLWSWRAYRPKNTFIIVIEAVKTN
uniref:Uncharacterized protein n=1 Tax=Lepeophtheirus salmonis TaxID=72036 RepID=A0A0K2U2Q2_LEPSM